MSALEDLLDQLDATRESTLVALETLPDEALQAPGVIGRWSIADLLSILTAWDAEVVTGLLRLKAGRVPERLLAAVANPDLYNAARYQDAQGRDLETIFNDFQGARMHLEEWLGELSERALTDPRHFKTLGGKPLGRLIAQATYEHEARYLPFLTTFAERWQEQDTGYEIRDTSSEESGDWEEELPTSVVIGLDGIDVLGGPGSNGDTMAFFAAEDNDDDDDDD
jgi:hypothetical protein